MMRAASIQADSIERNKATHVTGSELDVWKLGRGHCGGCHRWGCHQVVAVCAMAKLSARASGQLCR